MQQKRTRTAVDAIFGAEPGRVTFFLQVVILLAMILVINEFIDSQLTGWREIAYPGTLEVWERFIAYKPAIAGDWLATIRHLSVGILGCIPGFFIGMYFALWRKITPMVLVVIAGALSYSKLIMGINFFLITQERELTVFFFGWWVSGLYGLAIGYFNARKIVSGKHLIITQAGLDIAIMHWPQRRRFYWYFLVPHLLPELLLVLSLSSSAICGSFLFTESWLHVQGLGTKGYASAEMLENATLQVVGIALMLTNMAFWAMFNALFQRYEYFGTRLARLIDKALNRGL